MIAEKNKKGALRKAFQVLALSLLLVFLPLGSWYYLQQGLDYRLGALQELEDHGRLPAFTLETHTGEAISREALAGKILLANFMTLGNEERRAQFGEELRRLHLQFDEGNGVVFLVHLLDTLTDTPEAITRFATEYGLIDEQQCFFLTSPLPEIQRLAADGYKLPMGDGTGLTDSPYFALTDTTLTVRKYFDVRQPAEVKRLVEIVAIILPQIKERDLVFKREKEK